MLSMLHSADFFPTSVKFFALSEDGNTFVAGSQYNGVGLYRTSDYSPLERYYECEYVPPATPDGADSCRTTAHMFGVGYTNANTWYFTGNVLGKTREEYKYILHARSIDPSREITMLDVGMANGARAFPANRDYILQGNWLIDWRSGKHYYVDIPPPTPCNSAIPTLTPDNRVVTHVCIGEYEGIVIVDPIHETLEYWKEAARLGERIMVTPDNRYAIGLSRANYKCTLWRWPEKKEIGHCSETLYGIFGKKRTQYSPVLALSLDGKSFAVGVDNTVRVYRIEPFKLELEINMSDSVSALALSDDGWLAASDRKGFLRVWDVNAGNLVGQRRFSGNGLNEKYEPTLVFQPKGNKLFTTYGGITVFEIPKRPARQKAGSDSGK
jgi:WD40 repeat protein